MIRTWGCICRSDGTISFAQLVKLVRTLAPPIGIGPEASPSEAEEFVHRKGIVPVLTNRYTFQHTVWGLIASIAEVPVPDNAAAAAASKKVGQHFVQVYEGLGIVHNEGNNADSTHVHVSTIWGKLWGCLCWPFSNRRTRGKSQCESETGISKIGWSVFPSFTGRNSDSG